MNWNTVATIVLAVVAAASFLVGAIAWFYHRGGAERTLETTIKRNTVVTGELTQAVSSLSDKLVVGFKEVHDRIDAHDIEIAVAKRDIQHLTASMIVAVQPSPATKT